MVCEVDGTFQGLLPGDLASLGLASLYREQINNLLDILAFENEIYFVKIQPLSPLQLR